MFFLAGGPYHAACGILVLPPGIEPVPPALEAQSLNHCQGSPNKQILEIDLFSKTKHFDLYYTLKLKLL